MRQRQAVQLGTLFSRFFLCLLSLFICTSCIKSNQERPKAKGQENGAETTTGTGSGDDGGDDSAGGGDNSDDATSAIDALLTECGAKDLVDQQGGEGEGEGDEETVIYEKTIKSLPIVKNIILNRVEVNVTVNLKVTNKESVQSTQVDVKTERPLGRDLLQQFIGDANQGDVITDNVPFSEYTGLSKFEPWDGIVCTFVPATKLENKRGGETTVVRFEPPMPMNINPRAVLKRYEQEIGDKKVFSGMKVIVESTEDRTLKETEYTGTVTVERINPPTLTVKDGEEDREISGDIAYRMIYDFDSPKVTMALGMQPEITYLINTTNKDLKWNVLDTKSLVSGQVVLQH